VRVVGIDPGPDVCGVAIYDTDHRKCVWVRNKRTVGKALDDIAREGSLQSIRLTGIAIERVQSYGISGADLLRTAEVVGRLQQRAIDYALDCALIYRREVLAALDVTGKGNRDSLIRQRLIEMHGGSRRAAVGLKKEPGPLYGVSGHAWQALAVAITYTKLPVPF